MIYPICFVEDNLDLVLGAFKSILLSAHLMIYQIRFVEDNLDLALVVFKSIL
jgi:hypothetical protein